jgi:hypothetical protein
MQMADNLDQIMRIENCSQFARGIRARGFQTVLRAVREIETM